MNAAGTGSHRLTATHWLICIMASIGFAFDIYELLMLPLIVKPAVAALSAPLVQDLVAAGRPMAEAQALYQPGGAEFVKWARTLFFAPAIFGGIFGLIGGYLTDRLGRRRVLTFSILLYGGAAFASGFATSLPQLLVLRCLVFVGVCVEFVAAVAWLAEIFPDPLRREKVLGYTQAFSSIGGLLVAVANSWCVSLAATLPALHGVHEAWRYTLISGLIPAIPLILIRPFLPESPVWQKKKAEGRLRRPSFRELFRPEFARTTIITAVLFAAGYGIAFGAIQHLPQIVPGFADVKVQAKAAQDKLVADAQAAGKPAPAPKAVVAAGKQVEEGIAARVQKWQEIGGLVGRVLLAILAVRILSRRTLFRIFQIPAMIYVPLLFWWIAQNLGQSGSLALVQWGVFFAGMVTVAQFSFWGNYLPLVYPLHLRGTGESFAANIGGRIFGTSAAWFTFTFSASMPPSPAKIALTAAVVALTFALVGTLLTHWLPEPKAQIAEE